MQTKFKIDQEIWYMESNKPVKGTITEITIKKNANNKILTSYQINSKTSRLEQNIEDSKEGLMKNVFNF